MTRPEDHDAAALAAVLGRLPADRLLRLLLIARRLARHRLPGDTGTTTRRPAEPVEADPPRPP